MNNGKKLKLKKYTIIMIWKKKTLLTQFFQSFSWRKIYLLGILNSVPLYYTIGSLVRILFFIFYVNRFGIELLIKFSTTVLKLLFISILSTGTKSNLFVNEFLAKYKTQIFCIFNFWVNHELIEVLC